MLEGQNQVRRSQSVALCVLHAPFLVPLFPAGGQFALCVLLEVRNARPNGRGPELCCDWDWDHCTAHSDVQTRPEVSRVH